jgi:hypothetical protein
MSKRYKGKMSKKTKWGDKKEKDEKKKSHTSSLFLYDTYNMELRIIIRIKNWYVTSFSRLSLSCLFQTRILKKPQVELKDGKLWRRLKNNKTIMRM